jgi:hypothetical protein
MAGPFLCPARPKWSGLPKKIMKRGTNITGPPFLWASIFFILFSCAGSSFIKESRTSRIIPGIPFYPQEEYQCGPASLAEVLNFYGLKISPVEIAAEIFSKQARGTLDMDMLFYAQKKGLNATQYTGSWEDLQKNVNSNRPLIVLIDEGFWVYQKDHFIVVVGYDEGGLIVNSGKEQQAFVARDHFLKTWARTKYWTLGIAPK